MAERCFETVRTTFSIVSVPSCLVIDTRGAFRLLGPRRLPFSPETQPGKSRCFIMPIRNERNIVRCGSFSPRNEPVINPLEKNVGVITRQDSTSKYQATRIWARISSMRSNRYHVRRDIGFRNWNIVTLSREYFSIVRRYNKSGGDNDRNKFYFFVIGAGDKRERILRGANPLAHEQQGHPGGR